MKKKVNKGRLRDKISEKKKQKEEEEEKIRKRGERRSKEERERVKEEAKALEKVKFASLDPNKMKSNEGLARMEAYHHYGDTTDLSPSYTDDEIGRMIEINKGKVGIIARKMGINIDTLRGRIRDSEKLRDLVEVIGEEELDISENTVLRVRDMVDEDPREALKAAQFHLTHKGRDRGYGDTPPLQINIGQYNEGEVGLLKRIAEKMAEEVMAGGGGMSKEEKEGAVDVEYE